MSLDEIILLQKDEPKQKSRIYELKSNELTDKDKIQQIRVKSITF